MAINTVYAATEPTRAQIDALDAPTLLEFGVPWCPHCQAAQPLLAAALVDHPHVAHLKVEDGPGRPLGRSFRVKLWPTMIFLRGGQEIARLVRPGSSAEMTQAFAQFPAV